MRGFITVEVVLLFNRDCPRKYKSRPLHRVAGRCSPKWTLSCGTESDGEPVLQSE